MNTAGLAAAAFGIVTAATSFGAGLEIDFAAERGAIKPLHGVNNAPVRVNGKEGQDEFKSAGIPFVRTHDTAYSFGGYMLYALTLQLFSIVTPSR